MAENPPIQFTSGYVTLASTKDPLAVLDTPKVERAEEELPFTDIELSGEEFDALAESLGDCGVAAADADARFVDFHAELLVVRCEECNRLYQSDSTRIRNAKRLGSYRSDLDLDEKVLTETIYLCEGCEGVIRERSNPSANPLDITPFLSGSSMFRTYPSVWQSNDYFSNGANWSNNLLTSISS